MASNIYHDAVTSELNREGSSLKTTIATATRFAVPFDNFSQEYKTIIQDSNITYPISFLTEVLPKI